MAHPIANDNDYLLKERPLIVLPTLVKLLGTEFKAIIVQQIYWWTKENEEDAREKQATHFFDGHWWCYNSYTEWHRKNFPWKSERQIIRTFCALEMAGVIVGKDNDNANKGKWYRVNREVLNEMIRKLKEGKGPDIMSGPDMTSSQGQTRHDVTPTGTPYNTADKTTDTPPPPTPSVSKSEGDSNLEADSRGEWTLPPGAEFADSSEDSPVGTATFEDSPILSAAAPTAMQAALALAERQRELAQERANRPQNNSVDEEEPPKKKQYSSFNRQKRAKQGVDEANPQNRQNPTRTSQRAPSAPVVARQLSALETWLIEQLLKSGTTVNTTGLNAKHLPLLQTLVDSPLGKKSIIQLWDEDPKYKAWATEEIAGRMKWLQEKKRTDAAFKGGLGVESAIVMIQNMVNCYGTVEEILDPADEDPIVELNKDGYPRTKNGYTLRKFNLPAKYQAQYEALKAK